MLRDGTHTCSTCGVVWVSVYSAYTHMCVDTKKCPILSLRVPNILGFFVHVRIYKRVPHPISTRTQHPRTASPWRRPWIGGEPPKKKHMIYVRRYKRVPHPYLYAYPTSSDCFSLKAPLTRRRASKRANPPKPRQMKTTTPSHTQPAPGEL